MDGYGHAAWLGHARHKVGVCCVQLEQGKASTLATLVSAQGRTSLSNITSRAPCSHTGPLICFE